MSDFLNRLLDWMIAGNITAAEVILNIVLFIMGIILIRSLWRLHRRNGVYKNFNLVHLIINKEGFPDGAKCIEMGAFILLSWGFIAQITAGKLAEWYMQFYVGVFVLRGAYGAYLRSKGEPIDIPGTVVKTETVVRTKSTETTEAAPQPRIKVDEPT